MSDKAKQIKQTPPSKPTSPRPDNGQGKVKGNNLPTFQNPPPPPPKKKD